VAVKETRAIKKKPNTLHWDDRKDALRASQKLARCHPSQTLGSKIVNSLGRLSLGKRDAPWHLHSHKTA
jgi:hypothetical protein